MALADLIPNGGATVDFGASSRKQALQAMSETAANVTGLNARTIFEAVLQRERLGSTDFESIDGQPTDLIFLLLAPEDAGAEHLKALARVSRMLRREDVRQRLRAAPNADAVYAVLAGEPASDAA